MTQTKSIISGVALLSATGIICKLIGVFFRVPLVWLIGEESVGAYQLVFPTYTLLLTVSSAGLPVAISRMVSASLARGDPREARRVFRVALRLLAAAGFILAVLMAALSGWLSESLVHDPETLPGFVAIAPSVFIVCILSAYRGFMQGQQNMLPTAVSQLIEQVLKVLVALPLAWLGSRLSLAYAAAGALLGTSLAEAAALLYMLILNRKKRAAFDCLPQLAQTASSGRSLARQLIFSAVPITLGAAIVPLAGFVDSSMIMERLSRAGIGQSAARALYGCYSGCVINLINVPTALALAIAMSLVPAVSSAAARGDAETVRKQSALGLRFAFLIGLPCSAGMCLLAEQNFPVTADMLTVSALTIVLFTVVQATSGILQGLKKQLVPMLTLMVGVALKIILNAVLIPLAQINIHGAPLSSIVCYAVSMVLNLVWVGKATQDRLDWKAMLLRPLLATLVMSAAVFALNRALPAGRLWLIVTLAAGLVTYLLAAYAFKAVTREDMQTFKRRRRYA